MEYRPSKDNYYINLLTKIAEAVPPVRSAKLASAIVLKDEIVSFGFNQMKSHPFQLRYAKNTEAIYWHSENMAIFNASKKIDKADFRKATLYIARVKKPSAHNPNFIHGLACPCDGCKTAIDDFKIKRVVYTKDFEGISTYK
jgi:deoxycytidylate deaminase